MPVELVVEHLVQAVIIGAVMIGLAYSPLPRALAHRIIHGRARPNEPDPRVDDLVEDNAMLRRQLEEVQERVEFAERMLAQAQGKSLAAGRDD